MVGADGNSPSLYSRQLTGSNVIAPVFGSFFSSASQTRVAAAASRLNRKRTTITADSWRIFLLRVMPRNSGGYATLYTTRLQGESNRQLRSDLTTGSSGTSKWTRCTLPETERCSGARTRPQRACPAAVDLGLGRARRPGRQRAPGRFELRPPTCRLPCGQDPAAARLPQATAADRATFETLASCATRPARCSHRGNRSARGG